jgi:hypothetical protein
MLVRNSRRRRGIPPARRIFTCKLVPAVKCVTSPLTAAPGAGRAPRRSALAYPVHRRLGGMVLRRLAGELACPLRVLRTTGRRHVLAVAPGSPRAVLMVPAAAVHADHVPIVAQRPGWIPDGYAKACGP